MPNNDLMGWNKTQKRWNKRYRSNLYFVSPRQLGCEPTKEASRSAANSWWIKKQSEIDEELGKAKKHPAHLTDHYEEAKENWRLYGKWHRKYGSIETATEADSVIEFLTETLKQTDPPFPLPKLHYDPLWKLERNIQQDEDLLAFQVKWMDRYNTIRKDERTEDTVPFDNTIRSYIGNFLELKKAQFQARNKIGSFFSMKQWMDCFRNWVEPYADITTLNETLWERFYVYVAGKVANNDYSPATAKTYFGTARSFIRHCWERRLIELPRNLTSRQLVFAPPIKEPILFTSEEIGTYLGAATDKLNLYILLMLNCGMYGNDIANLTQTEVDWDNGRVFRKRSKTRHKSENVPKVDYPLWKETFSLLKHFRSNHPTLVLVNENGETLVDETEVAGKWNRKNNVKTEYFRLQYRKLKLPKGERKPLKSLRKTGATLLEQSIYGRFSEHYLGEAPSTMASRHYVHKNGPEFDEAILWLGKQLGIE
ncbi:MAG: tyrosine-type recombinase/integrase [Thermoguttaceae bacterium]